MRFNKGLIHACCCRSLVLLNYLFVACCLFAGLTPSCSIVVRFFSRTSCHVLVIDILAKLCLGSSTVVQIVLLLLNKALVSGMCLLEGV